MSSYRKWLTAQSVRAGWSRKVLRPHHRHHLFVHYTVEWRLPSYCASSELIFIGCHIPDRFPEHLRMVWPGMGRTYDQQSSLCIMGNRCLRGTEGTRQQQDGFVSPSLPTCYPGPYSRFQAATTLFLFRLRGLPTQLCTRLPMLTAGPLLHAVRDALSGAAQMATLIFRMRTLLS
jgi:hypothetical protein